MLKEGAKNSSIALNSSKKLMSPLSPSNPPQLKELEPSSGPLAGWLKTIFPISIVGVVVALPQKRSGKSNGSLADNTKDLSFFGIMDYLGYYCPHLPCFLVENGGQICCNITL